MKKILLLLLILTASVSADTSGTNYTLRSNLKKELKISGSQPMQGDLDMNSFDIINAGDLDVSTITTDSIIVALLTATRVIFAGTDGLLSDDPDLTFLIDTLYATNLTSTGTITGGTLTDGTASLTGGVMTGMDIDGNWTWTGNSTWDCSDASKIVEINNSNGFVFEENSKTYLALVPGIKKIILGNTTDDQEFEFAGDGAFNKLGSGLTTLGGNLLVNGGDIGITADTDLLELATDLLTVNGDVTVVGGIDLDADIITIKTAAGFQRAMRIGPQNGTVDDGSFIEFTSSSADGFGSQIGGIRDGGSGANALVFLTGGSSQTERMRISNDGKIGITNDLTITNASQKGIIFVRGGVTVGSITTGSNRLTLSPEDGLGVVVNKSIDNSATDPFDSASIWGATNSDNTFGAHIPIRYTVSTSGDYGLIDIARPANNAIDISFGFRTTVSGGFTEILSLEIDGSNNKRAIITGNVRIGDTTTPILGALEVKGASFFGDPEQDYTTFSATGVKTFVGAAGLLFGQMSIPGVDIEVTTGDANPHEVSHLATGDGWATGELNQVTFGASGSEHLLKASAIGRWKIIWQMSAHTDGGGGTAVHGGVRANGAFVRDCGEGHTHVFNANDDQQLSGVCIVDITSLAGGNDEISLWIQSDNSQNVHVEHGDMYIEQIGGT